MRELDQDVLADPGYAMYIAIAPRDPREPGSATESSIEFLEPVTANELAEALLKRGVPAQIIDGAHVGAPGWVIARTVGLATGTAPRWAPQENTTVGDFPTIAFEDLASGLAQDLNAACHVADHPNVPSTHAHIESLVVDINKRSNALIGQFRSTDGPLLANAIGEDVWFAHGEPWSIVACDEHDPSMDTVLGWGTNKPAILFERNGAWRRMTLVYRDYVGIHEWGPRWANVDPRGERTTELLSYIDLEDIDPAQFVFDFFETPRIVAEDLAAALALNETQVNRLQLVLNAPSMDDPFAAISRIIGLPEEGAEVADGWREPYDLTGVIEVPHEDFSRAVWSSATTVPSERDVSSRVMSMWLRRPPSYYVLNVAEAGALGILTALAAKKGYKKVAVATGLLTVLTVADFFVPATWRGQAKKIRGKE